MLKVYDMMITNVDLLANSSNQGNVSRIFEEHSTNVCFENIQKISPENCNDMEIFLEVKKVEKIVLWVML